ncbi:DUF433 domain-containing protein [Marinoscillum sp.]|uniref:DUF433 domain-containing protein n=1 Tax=Marinoscillum sp. TaxID=2024838 RepID=UPI003BAD92D7
MLKVRTLLVMSKPHAESMNSPSQKLIMSLPTLLMGSFIATVKYDEPTCPVDSTRISTSRRDGPTKFRACGGPDNYRNRVAADIRPIARYRHLCHSELQRKLFNFDIMEWREHVISDNNVLLGKPIVKGTRVSVEHIIGLLCSRVD